jgi:phosphoglycerate dehydrogenase-like enzyme
MKYYNHLRAKFPELTVNMVDHHSKVGPYIESTDILVSFGVQLADHVYKEGRNLKWIQALGTGVDGIIGEPSLREDVLVTNMHGLHGASMPESAILSMLALARDLPRVLRNQARHAWDRCPSRLLKGKTVGIFGVGAIAEDLAPKCKMFGMSVVGITSAKRQVAGFDRMVGRDRLEEAVRELDYLLLLTPYAPQTRGIVDARILAAMKPTSFLINLARGGVVDEQALIQALKGKKIAGAALDVFAEEPLPGGHPFWDMENVIVTPHLGGFHDQYPEQALPTVEENVRKFLAGDTKNMINVVRRPPGA